MGEFTFLFFFIFIISTKYISTEYIKKMLQKEIPQGHTRVYRGYTEGTQAKRTG